MDGEVTSRLFGWDDVAGVHELISTSWAERGARSYLHIGDFYSSLRPGVEFDPLRHLRLWQSGETVVAFAWFDAPASGEVVLRPGAPAALWTEALEWLEGEHRRSGGGPSFTIAAIDDDLERIAMLEARGYARGDSGGVRFHQRIDTAPVPAPPRDGIALRSVSGDGDIERRVFVQRTSFERSSATVQNWRAMMQLAGYRAELDLIAVAPDGTGAGASTSWYDEANRCGEFEPVGTSRAYQRRGIGKAVVTEGLRRLRALGATQAIVQTNITNETAIALYRSCGFELVATEHEWVKEL